MKKIVAFISMALVLCLMLSGCIGGPFRHVPNPQATITLTDGSVMRFDLFVDEAPNTVANFVELANKGFYDGQKFFRVIPGVLAQAGDPKNDGTGNAGYAIQGEFDANGIPNKLQHDRGTISMCRQSGSDTASSQFFILASRFQEYDGQYAAFGKAADDETLNTLDTIMNQLVDSFYRPIGAMPTILTVRVETHGYSYEAAKMDLPTPKPEPTPQTK